MLQVTQLLNVVVLQAWGEFKTQLKTHPSSRQADNLLYHLRERLR